jgi:hypothetical protein
LQQHHEGRGSQDSDDFEIQPWDGSPISPDASPMSPAPAGGPGGTTSGHASTAISPAKPTAAPQTDERSFAAAAAAPGLPRGDVDMLGLTGLTNSRTAGWDGEERAAADFDPPGRDRSREGPYHTGGGSSRWPGDGPDDPRLYRSSGGPDRQQQYEQQQQQQQRMFSDSSYYYGGVGGEAGRQAGRARDSSRQLDLGPPPYSSSDPRGGPELMFRDHPHPYHPGRAAEHAGDYPPGSGPSSRRGPYGTSSREPGEGGRPGSSRQGWPYPGPHQVLGGGGSSSFPAYGGGDDGQWSSRSGPPPPHLAAAVGQGPPGNSSSGSYLMQGQQQRQRQQYPGAHEGFGHDSAAYERLDGGSVVGGGGVGGGAATGSTLGGGDVLLTGGTGPGSRGPSGAPAAAGGAPNAHSDLRIAVTDVIKDMLKPVWKSGKLSREVRGPAVATTL